MSIELSAFTVFQTEFYYKANIAYTVFLLVECIAKNRLITQLRAVEKTFYNKFYWFIGSNVHCWIVGLQENFIKYK